MIDHWRSGDYTSDYDFVDADNWQFQISRNWRVFFTVEWWCNDLVRIEIFGWLFGKYFAFRIPGRYFDALRKRGYRNFLWWYLGG